MNSGYFLQRNLNNSASMARSNNTLFFSPNNQTNNTMNNQHLIRPLPAPIPSFFRSTKNISNENKAAGILGINTKAPQQLNATAKSLISAVAVEEKPDMDTKISREYKAQHKNVILLTGNADRLIKWHRMKKGDDFWFYELIASVIAIRESNVRYQKIMLLRERKGGPVIQVVYCDTDHIVIEGFYIGQMLKCFGHMVGPNILRAYKIRAASEEELANLPRMIFIGDHAVARKIEKP